MIAHFKKGDFDRLEIPVPDRSTQEEVGQIYLLLSQKIEQNNRMAATREEMARTLYRSWFVDFDPVKAKAEGLAPAFMDDATAALFPDRFGDDGLPDGWNLLSLGEFFKFQRGLSYKGKFLTEVGAPMINLGCFKGDGGFDSAKFKNYSGETKERNWVQPGDLVFANTDMTQNRLILGSPHVVEGNSNEAFLYSHHVFAARPTTTDSRLWTRFIFFQLLQPEFRERAEGFATGTTVLFLPADAAEALSFAAPDLPLVQAFNDETDPWLERAKNLRAENQTLTALRDTLLLKLMSGELRVGEARDQIEEVA
jgi:type I restriction enzyme S subunit